MTLTEPESTLRETPTRRGPLVPILAGALVLTIAATVAMAVHASGDVRRSAASACESALHTLANNGSGGIDVAGAMTVRTLPEYVSAAGTVLFDEEGGSGSVSASEAAAFYTDLESRQAAQGIQSLIVTGTMVGNDQKNNVACLVSFQNGQVIAAPGLWFDLF